MAQTTTQTSTRTKVIAAVAVVAALGFIGFAAAIMVPKTLTLPDLVVSITQSDEPVGSSKSVTYHITASNSGTANAKDVLIQAEFPSDGYLSPEGYLVTSGSASCTQSTGGSQVLDCYADIAAGASVEIESVFENVGFDNDVIVCDDSHEVSIEVKVDADGTVKERNEKNNRANLASTLEGPACVNLKARLTTDSGEHVAGSKLQMSATFIYQFDTEVSDLTLQLDTPGILAASGYADSSSRFPDLINLEDSCSQDVDGDETCLVSMEEGAGEQDLGFEYDIPATAVACGTFDSLTFNFTVDTTDAFIESDETDNASDYTVVVAGLPCE